MSDVILQRALGRPIPDSPHAVSVSLPTWADVVGYEEGDPRVLDKLACGYPRFVYHPRVRALFAAAEADLAEAGERALVLPTLAAAERCRAFVEAQGVSARVVPWKGLAVVLVPAGAEAIAKPYWQHTGEIVSSRLADAVLAGRAFEEAPEASDAIRDRLASLAGASRDDVSLYPTGMAAIAVALRLVQALSPDRPTAQFGFPYLDSLKLQQKFGVGVHFYPIGDTTELAALEARLAAGEVAGVFCEVPSNPLMRSPDLARLAAATRAAGVPLVLDDSIATFANLDLTPYADVLVSSLTKNFAGSGEAMAGALVLNARSPLYDRLASHVAPEAMLFGDDARVIAEGAVDFETRMAAINANAERLADFLAAHPAVARVYYPKFETPEAYRAALKPGGGYGGMLSLELVDGDHRAPGFYDRLAVDKGPSFGLRKTLVCPYTLLAHYTELDWAEQCGVARHLIRVSVGCEDAGDLISRFSEALPGA